MSAAGITHSRGGGAIVLVEFGDYECPFCARHARTTVPLIAQKWVETGQIRYSFLHFPLETHAYARRAAEAAECAGAQGRFWDMHDGLFGARAPLTVENLAMMASTLDIDHRRFVECLEGGHMVTLVDSDRLKGQRLGVQATPSFFVGILRADGQVDFLRRIHGAVSFQIFEKVIRELQHAQITSAGH
jgi:protein-disulfide isomerase